MSNGSCHGPSTTYTVTPATRPLFSCRARTATGQTRLPHGNVWPSLSFSITAAAIVRRGVEGRKEGEGAPRTPPYAYTREQSYTAMYRYQLAG